jgi:pRiA4b ORF-3-like protein
VTRGESATGARVAEEATGCAVLRRAVALSKWAGPGGRALTSVGVLRKPDVPAACATIGVAPPERFRSAGDIQDLRRPWTVAVALGLLAVDGGRAASGPALGEWPPTGTALTARWLDSLLAVCDATCQDVRRSLGLRLQLLAVLRILGDSRAGRQRLAFHDLLASAADIGNEYGLDYGEVDLVGGSSDLSRGFLDDSVGALLDLLADFGAVTLPPGSVTPLARSEQSTRALPAITPLGRWAAEALAASLPRAVAPDASPAKAIAAAAHATREGRLATVRRWLGARKPDVAVRELLEAADPMSARLRAAAVDAARMTGRDGLPGWAAIARHAATWPNSARHARAELSRWEMDATGVVPPPDAADRHWRAVEAAAAALESKAADSSQAVREAPGTIVDQGADEALCRLWEAADDTDSIDGVLAWARASGHPEATQVSGAIAALAASGSPLTVRQGIQLKVALRHSRPPVWRSVQVPLLFTLGDLHRIIQVLFGWDGDHLHDFTVGTTHYSDPFFGLEETEDEEDARLRDAFPVGARKPVLYEYDLAASWVHEVTREKVFKLDPVQSYPACVAFRGEQPVEYADEYDEDEYEYPDADQSAGREPFSLAAVNAALAELAAPSN